ncbi:hypothetical protein CRYPA_1833 [uncultured Candidatus Thioglobus sp.]|nr:hypothetical protein CRYPA_1833 [uncultured Candidatus Thioglobus sp.]
MTPETRAYKTCHNDVTVRHYKSQIYQYTNEIEKIDDSLLKGYKTRKNCTTITYERTSKDKPVNSIKKICTDVVIPINDYVYEFEKSRRAELVIQLKDLQDREQLNFDKCFDKCFDKIQPMNAEQAFHYYDS